jgi:hypothetical protein
MTLLISLTCSLADYMFVARMIMLTWHTCIGRGIRDQMVNVIISSGNHLVDLDVKKFKDTTTFKKGFLEE